MRCGTTVSSNQGRLRWPPEAARTAGPPKGAATPMHQSREAHHPARPLHSPEGAMTGTPLEERVGPVGSD
jgi:hypothetical protein